MTPAATSTSAPAVNFGLSVVAIRRKFGQGAEPGKCAEDVGNNKCFTFPRPAPMIGPVTAAYFTANYYFFYGYRRGDPVRA
jgi:hypothetical protein